MPVIVNKPSNQFGYNREQWLTELSKQVVPLFSQFHLEKKPFNVTCGWPSSGGLGKSKRTIGQCFCASTSTAGMHEIFISPTIDSPLLVAGVLCHEIAHVAAGTKAGHGKWFKTVCRAVGLTKGPSTQVLPGNSLQESLAKMIEKLGDYPHKAISPSALAAYKGRKRPVKSRTVLTCDCGCKVTIGVKWLSVGMPTCVCGVQFTEPETE